MAPRSTPAPTTAALVAEPAAEPVTPRILQATMSFAAAGVTVNAGDTVEEGHPLLAGREALFAPFRPTFSLPVASAATEPAAAEAEAVPPPDSPPADPPPAPPDAGTQTVDPGAAGD